MSCMLWQHLDGQLERAAGPFWPLMQLEAVVEPWLCHKMLCCGVSHSLVISAGKL